MKKNFVENPNAIHVYDQSREHTGDDFAFSSDAPTAEEYMNAKIS